MRTPLPFLALLLSCPVALPGRSACAAVKPHALISDGMVLQRGMSVPVWGTAAENEKVTVRFQGQEVTTTARNGKWLVRLRDLQAGGPFDMTIAGSNTVRLKDVYVGEVWVCCGQSNMWWPVSRSGVPKEVVANCRNPSIRFFTVPLQTAPTPQAEVMENPKGDQEGLTGKIPYTPTWKECRPEIVPDLSAVGFFFARELHKALGVPVGLLHCPVGGTWVEAWASDRALQAHPDLKGLPARFREEYSRSVADYLAKLEKHREATLLALREFKDLPRPPEHPDDAVTRGFHLPLSRNVMHPSIFYNGMVAPLMPYGIKGAIWYQGESNTNRPALYREIFSAVIRSWREGWQQGDFPFLFVQLPPFGKIVEGPQESRWAEVREAQRRTSREVPWTGMVTTGDVGDQTDIHPHGKDVVGARLALAARAVAYGEKVEYSGPVYDRMEIKEGKALLNFKHSGGLVARGGPLRGFTVAGPDRKYVKAEAEVRGDRVVVWSPRVARPVAVRFGWADYPVINLWNKQGLPASPFQAPERARGHQETAP